MIVMHTKFFWPVCLVAMMSGCVYNRQSIILREPVGPQPLLERTTMPKLEGQLVVYSGQETKTIGDSDYTVYSTYKIYAGGGKLLMSASNQEGSFGERPSVVGLPAGSYTVVAKALGYKSVTIPVEIENFKMTTLYLDGSGARLKKSGAESDFVRLPDGSIIGWRAKQDGHTNK
jgi:hypothetical protein